MVVAVNTLKSKKLMSKILRDPEEVHILGAVAWLNPVGHNSKQV